MSLPTAWVKQNGLKQGDNLFLEQKGLVLKISPSLQKKKGKRTVVDVTGCKRGIINGVLTTLYTRGDDEFVIHYDTPEQFAVISEGVRILLGFDIVEHKNKTCVLKELAHAEKENFDQVLRRILLLLLNMAEEGIQAFKNKADLRALAMQDSQINSLVLFCLRVLNKRGINNAQKAMHMYSLLNFLEQLGDAYQRLYVNIKTVDKKTINIAIRQAKLVRGFYELYYKFDLLKASALKADRDATRAEISKLLPNTKRRDDLLALHHLGRIGDLVIDTAKFQLAMQI